MATETPYFMIEARSGGYRALFFGANHKLVWWTQVYNEYATALQAVEWARYWAPSAPLKP
jgi:uncharacterized protein YegP (UPF0339 family)